MPSGDDVNVLELDGKDSFTVQSLYTPLNATYASEESTCIFHYLTLCRYRMAPAHDH